MLPPDARQRLDALADMHKVNLDAITSIEYDFAMRVGAFRYVGRHKVEGDKRWFGVAIELDGILSRPTEQAWDGESATARTFGSPLQRAPSLDAVLPPGCDDLFSLIAYYGGDAIRGLPHNAWTFRPVDVTPGEASTYQVRYVIEPDGYDLIVTYDAGRGALPTAAVATNEVGERIFDYTVEEVSPMAVGASTVYVPIRIEVSIGNVGTPLTFAVDEPTLRVGHDIDDETFALRPLPGQQVWDVQSGEVMTPAQADLVEVEPGFPFNVLREPGSTSGTSEGTGPDNIARRIRESGVLDQDRGGNRNAASYGVRITLAVVAVAVACGVFVMVRRTR